jgi:hypothetical protein
MSRLSTYGSRLCTAGMINFLAIVPGAGSVRAQNLNDVVRGLNTVLNPNDARRFEYQAYQNGRWNEQRYWHDYGAGLASSNRNRPDYGPDPRDQQRYGSRGGYGDWDYGKLPVRLSR